jgi:lipopolysaccharide biosynthesis regulator YciM
MLIKQGQADQALPCIKKAVEINPRSSRHQFILGRLLLARDDDHSGEGHFRTSV